MTDQISPPRTLAAELLDKWSHSGGFADALLGQALDDSELDTRDRSLAAEMFLGVVRRRESLDCVLTVFSSRPLPRLSPAVLNLLRLAAYQIIFLERVPSYAAVDSAVRQAKKLSHTGLHKFVNAVLRNLERSLAKDMIETNQELLKRALPLQIGKWRYFDRDIFAAPDDDPALHIAQVYSCSEWLARQWWARFDLPAAIDVALASVIRGPMTLRPNTLRTTRTQFLEALTNMGIPSGPLSQGPGVWVRQMPPIQNQLFQAGHFQPQGPTAMRAGEFTGVRPGQTVLDFCAGLGTKATHLAELMDNEGILVASDISTDKLRRARENAARLGINCMEFLSQDQLAKRFGLGEFDVVLVDVPCSNTGVLVGRPDAKWRVGLADQQELAHMQMAILCRAAEFVRPDGTLIYSTCSIEPAENDELATEFARRSPQWEFLAEEAYLPSISTDPADWHDGGYMAKWSRGN